MRYLCAMIAAAILAAIATLFVSVPLANAVVRQFTFDSPDQVASLHAAAFMGANLAALLIGWGLGWLIAGRFAQAD